MKYNMTAEEYNILYKRHLKRSPKELLELAGLQKGMSVLDLGSGSNGRASIVAKEMGADVVIAVDDNKYIDMLKKYGIEIFYGKVYEFFNTVETSFYNFPVKKFDIVIAQQSINYWFWDDGTNGAIFEILKNNGKFVFNTFNTCPSEKITVKKYKIDDLNYCEVFNYKDGVVYHLQSADGLKPHYTEFQWISPERFEFLLEPFDFEVKTDGNTDIYVCCKKKAKNEN